MPTALSGCPSTQRTYQTLGDLYLISDLDTEQECKEFVRELDLEQAICRVSFYREMCAMNGKCLSRNRKIVW